uniref:C2H2-type domain-containing protein n=1 Tax=Schizophyllum commune (strain H4-8 / FGSC 9210) TaxID=578458 RepID=D8QGA0_SCHCM
MSSEGPRKRIRKVHLPAVLPCPHPGCTAGPFRNKTGLGSHITARHRVAVLPPDEQRLRLTTSEQPQLSSSPPPPSSPSPPPLNLEESASAGPSGAPRGPEDNTGNNDGWRPLKDGGKVRYHPVLNESGRPCDKDGNFLPPNAPPPEDDAPQPADNDWSPFDSRESFQLADLLYRKGQVSAPFINELLDIWASTLSDTDYMEPPFANAKDVYETIDAIPHGSVPWESFTMTFDGQLDSDVPPEWQTSEYEVFFRCPRKVLHTQLQNPDYADQMDFAPKRLYNAREKRVFSDYMSGNHPWRQADKVAEEVPEADGAVYCPAIFGSDKTTVSVATGQNEFYPLYMSNGLVHNTVRRGHRGAVTLIGFLSIPKTDKEHHDSATFRSFRRQLLHASLRFILLRLRPGMKTPEIVRYGDGHYRKTIYGIGPYIADYPEQVLLACIVQGWCPRCTAHPDDLDGASTRRKHSHTDALLEAFDAKTLWDDYGVIPDCKPFTYDFPYADIHELLTSDLLHQCIRGTFKDHLITWIFDYLELKYGKAAAERIIADIDRRIAAVPSFPGLRRFPQGRGFKQWTGDDSKALMKVILPAIEGYVPAQMVRAVSSFLEFCYLVRRNTIDEDAITQIQAALERFHRERVVFELEGVRPDGGFSIPRQHALVHYVHVIQEFGALNGLCSSITESAHIRAVKKPWRRSNRYNALRQMLVINERIDKLSACRTDFESRHMLSPQQRPIAYDLPLPAATGDDEDDAGASESRKVMGEVILAKTRVRNLGPRNVDALSDRLNLPSLRLLIQRFLYEQAHPQSDIPSIDIPPSEYPSFDGNLHVVGSAIATFYAPSDQCGAGGMHRERIRSVPSWRGGAPRRDCVFVTQNEDEPGFRGLHAARVMLFFSFRHEGVEYPCALVAWYSAIGDAPYPDTGLWMVEPDIDETGERIMDVIHVDAILRGAHLIGAAGGQEIPLRFSHLNSLDCFKAFFVNKYADHHAFEIAY